MSNQKQSTEGVYESNNVSNYHTSGEKMTNQFNTIKKVKNLRSQINTKEAEMNTLADKISFEFDRLRTFENELANCAGDGQATTSLTHKFGAIDSVSKIY
jgi:hypothetical protein